LRRAIRSRDRLDLHGSASCTVSHFVPTEHIFVATEYRPQAYEPFKILNHPLPPLVQMEQFYHWPSFVSVANLLASISGQSSAWLSSLSRKHQLHQSMLPSPGIVPLPVGFFFPCFDFRVCHGLPPPPVFPPAILGQFVPPRPGLLVSLHRFARAGLRHGPGGLKFHALCCPI